MKTARPFLYSIIGFFIGGILGIVLLGIVLPNESGIIGLAIPLIAALLGAYALWTLGAKLSRVQSDSEKTGGNFVVANYVGWTFLITAALINLFLPSIVATNLILSFVVGCLITVFAVWVGVNHVERRKLWRADHNPLAVTGWVTGIIGVVTGVFMSLSFLIPEAASYVTTGVLVQVVVSFLILFVSVYLLSKRAIEHATARAIARI